MLLFTASLGPGVLGGGVGDLGGGLGDFGVGVGDFGGVSNLSFLINLFFIFGSILRRDLLRAYLGKERTNDYGSRF